MRIAVTRSEPRRYFPPNVLAMKCSRTMRYEKSSLWGLQTLLVRFIFMGWIDDSSNNFEKFEETLKILTINVSIWVRLNFWRKYPTKNQTERVRWGDYYRLLNTPSASRTPTPDTSAGALDTQTPWGNTEPKNAPFGARLSPPEGVRPLVRWTSSAQRCVSLTFLTACSCGSWSSVGICGDALEFVAKRWNFFLERCIFVFEHWIFFFSVGFFFFWSVGICGSASNVGGEIFL